MRNLNRLFGLAAIPLISLFLFSCGGGGGSSTTGTVAPAGTGSVTLLVTDAPSDDFDAINLTVSQVELLSDSDSVVLYSGSKTFDLLQLASITEIFSVTDVPVGTYNKIRLTLTAIELVLKDGSMEYPSLPGNGKLDLNPRGSFAISSGSRLFLQLDMDAEKSIKADKSGNGKYQFRPVIFVKVVTDSFDTKLVRLQGTVDNLDSVNGRFDLCRIQAQGKLLDDDSEDGNPYCVAIKTTQDTSFFDSSADATDIDTMSNGDTATAVGRFALAGNIVMPSSDSGDDRSEVANRDDESRDDGSNDDDSSDDAGNGKLSLIAAVVWQDNQGDFTQLRGIARSAVTFDEDKGRWFKFSALPGQDVPTDAAFPVIVQPTTRLFSREGFELDAKLIQPGVPAQVDGVFDVKPNQGDLKSTLIILDTGIFQTQLVGVIGSVESDFSGLNLLAEAGDRCVTFNPGMRVFETSLDADNTISFEQRTRLSLAAGQVADVFGDENTTSGCLEADTIIYEEDGAVIQPI